jgi:hypothetical protein
MQSRYGLMILLPSLFLLALAPARADRAADVKKTL